jgi:hypothetical protein
MANYQINGIDAVKLGALRTSLNFYLDKFPDPIVEFLSHQGKGKSHKLTANVKEVIKKAQREMEK